MNKKHLFWIVPSCIALGFIVGMLTYAMLNMYGDRLLLEALTTLVYDCVYKVQ